MKLPHYTAKTIVAAILLTGICTGAALADNPSDTAQRLDSLFIDLPYAPFVWTKAEGVSERAAMRLPVMLDGMAGSFQLDTGLDVTQVYGNLLVSHGWEEFDGMYHVPSFTIGGIDLGSVWLRSRDEENEGMPPNGSIGMDLLVGHVVLIDYPGQRFALLGHGEVPLWMWQRASWTPAELRDAKLFLNLTIGGKAVEGMFFDTGSSTFDIIVDRDRWQELTGLTGPEDAPVRLEVNSWGHPVHAIGAPGRGALVIGSAHIDAPRLFYLEEQPNLFAAWPFPATGLVGNAPFWDRVVIIDLGLRPRFGVLR